MAAKRKRPTGLLKRAPRTTLTPTDQRVWADMILHHAEAEQAKAKPPAPPDDAVSDQALNYGRMVAERLFDKGKGQRSEMHVSPTELAAIIACAFHTGLGVNAPDQVRADRDDYERRWLEECRAHGNTRRRLVAAQHELGDHSDCHDPAMCERAEAEDDPDVEF